MERTKGTCRGTPNMYTKRNTVRGGLQRIHDRRGDTESSPECILCSTMTAVWSLAGTTKIRQNFFIAFISFGILDTHVSHHHQYSVCREWTLFGRGSTHASAILILFDLGLCFSSRLGSTRSLAQPVPFLSSFPRIIYLRIFSFLLSCLHLVCCSNISLSTIRCPLCRTLS